MSQTPDLLEGLTSSAVSDAAGQIWSPQATSAAATTTMRCIVEGKAVAGPAYTVRISPRHELDPDSRSKLFTAYAGVPAGAVVVVQVVGEVGGAVMGDVVAHTLQLAGVAGLVIDGQIRDVAALRAMGLPVWSRDVTPRAIRTKEIITEVNIEVTCDGVPVRPRDYVVADDDGVFFVPQDQAEPIFELAQRILAEEAESHVQLAAGASILDAYKPMPTPAQ